MLMLTLFECVSPIAECLVSRSGVGGPEDIERGRI
jgi:hypothetical protein